MKLKTTVRANITFLVIILILAINLITFFGINRQGNLMGRSIDIIEEELKVDNDKYIKAQVDSVKSMLSSLSDQVKKGTLNEATAKELAVDLIRNMSYEEGSYFWVDTTAGTNVVGGEKEGANRLDYADASGAKVVQSFIETAKNGGGYTEYVYQKDSNTNPSPKRAYTTYFEPFDWVIGTGKSTVAINMAVGQKADQLVSVFQVNRNIMILVTMITNVVAVVYAFYIIHKVMVGLRLTKAYIEVMSKGDFSQPMPVKLAKRRDDFGILSKALQQMKDNIVLLIKGSKEEALAIGQMMSDLNDQMGVFKNNVEDISATTEELSAGMEETSASTEQMSTNTVQMGSDVAKIAGRSTDGAQKAQEISKRAQITNQNVEMAKQRAYEVKDDVEHKLKEAIENVKVVEEINILSESIMSITSQTNLLSLNASIEAARAGESGRGFSVVANEIGHLAEQSAATVNKIQSVTSKVQDAVYQLHTCANNLLEFVLNDVSKDYEMFLDVGNSYNEDASFIASMVQDFNDTSKELKSSIESVANAVEEVARSTSEGAQGTTDIAEKNSSLLEVASSILKAIKETDAKADVLVSEINKFKIAAD